MEQTLKHLLDFQKFEGNAELQQIINSTHSRYAVRELSMDEMDWVNAAGIPETIPEDKNRKAGPDERQY